MYPRMSKLVNTTLFVPVLNVRDAIGIRFASLVLVHGLAEAKPSSNACLVRQIRS